METRRRGMVDKRCGINCFERSDWESLLKRPTDRSDNHSIYLTAAVSTLLHTTGLVAPERLLVVAARPTFVSCACPLSRNDTSPATNASSSTAEATDLAPMDSNAVKIAAQAKWQRYVLRCPPRWKAGPVRDPVRPGGAPDRATAQPS
jgi:hypothetical protein